MTEMEPWRTRRDPMDDFARQQLTFGGVEKLVLVAGEGPAVIVMCEIPGITPELLRFARRVRELGLSIYLPSLFGEPGRPAGDRLYGMRSVVKGCVSHEFRALRDGVTAPVTDWLRALAAHAHRERGGPGVGAVGMCFTGNFALSMMLEPSVIAPVLCQPSLPLRPSGIHTAPGDLRTIRARMEREDRVALAYRFEGDRLCRRERFDAYERALGDRIRLRTIPDAAANPEAHGMRPHSVVTQHLIDRAGEPTHAALEEILGLFRDALLPGRERPR